MRACTAMLDLASPGRVAGKEKLVWCLAESTPFETHRAENWRCVHYTKGGQNINACCGGCVHFVAVFIMRVNMVN